MLRTRCASSAAARSGARPAPAAVRCSAGRTTAVAPLAAAGGGGDGTTGGGNTSPPLAAPRRLRLQRTAKATPGDSAGANNSLAALSPVSSGLVRVIRDELKIERERYRQSESLMGGPPEPWELDDRPGSNALALARLFGPGGREEVLVEVDLDAQLDDPSDLDGEDGVAGSSADEEGDGDEGGVGGAGGGAAGELPPVRFTVSVAKGGRLLAFECESSGEYVQILHVSLEDLEEEEEEDEEEEEGGEDGDDGGVGGLGGAPPYAGPVFAELDETLQQAFSDFLEERGVDADLALYLMELVQDKLEVEYCRWLGSVAEWLEA